jgi:hypothetical protein
MQLHIGAEGVRMITYTDSDGDIYVSDGICGASVRLDTEDDDRWSWCVATWELDEDADGTSWRMCDCADVPVEEALAPLELIRRFNRVIDDLRVTVAVVRGLMGRS